MRVENYAIHQCEWKITSKTQLCGEDRGKINNEENFDVKDGSQTWRSYDKKIIS